VRDGALWGRVEWTPHGAAALIVREYRYISPVFQYSSDGEVTRLLRAGLTNNPNLYLTAISARATADATVRTGLSAHAIVADDDAGRDQGEATETLLDQLREILDLDDEASAEEVLAVIRDLAGRKSDDEDGDGKSADDGDGGAEDGAGTMGSRNRSGAHRTAGEADPARYVAVAQFQKVLGELNRLRAERTSERAERAVDDAIKAGKLTPAQRQWAIPYCRADFNGFADFVARQPAAFGPGFEAAASATFTPHPPASRGAMTATETAICQQLGLGVEDYLRRKRVGRGDFLRLNQ